MRPLASTRPFDGPAAVDRRVNGLGPELATADSLSLHSRSEGWLGRVQQLLPCSSTTEPSSLRNRQPAAANAAARVDLPLPDRPAKIAALREGISTALA